MGTIVLVKKKFMMWFNVIWLLTELYQDILPCGGFCGVLQLCKWMRTLYRELYFKYLYGYEGGEYDSRDVNAPH